jgi:hypothetical protein
MQLFSMFVVSSRRVLASIVEEVSCRKLRFKLFAPEQLTNLTPHAIHRLIIMC